jgi:hypothetical protein
MGIKNFFSFLEDPFVRVEKYFSIIKGDLQDCLDEISNYTEIYYYLCPIRQVVRLKIVFNDIDRSMIPEMEMEMENIVNRLRSLGLHISKGKGYGSYVYYDKASWLIDIGKPEGEAPPRRTDPPWKKFDFQ